MEINEGKEEERGRSGDGGDEEQEAITSTPEGDSERRGEEAVGRSGQGCVYFIETHDGAFVKIGYSIRVARRFNQIGVLLPGLRLIGYMPGTMSTESWLHEKFTALRENGEWFHHTDELRAFIGNLGLITELISESQPAQQREKRVISMMPNAAAQALAAQRWSKTTKSERGEVAQTLNASRWANATPEERAAQGKRLAQARAKKRAATKRAGK